MIPSSILSRCIETTCIHFSHAHIYIYIHIYTYISDPVFNFHLAASKLLAYISPMRTYTYTYIYIHTSVIPSSIFTSLHQNYLHTFLPCANIHIHIHIYTYISDPVFNLRLAASKLLAYLSPDAQRPGMYVCMYIYMCVCIFMYIYIHIYVCMYVAKLLAYLSPDAQRPGMYG